MRKTSYYMLTFSTTHDAIQAEKRLGERLPVAVMPTLRQVSASCGISLRIEEADWPRLAGIPWARERSVPYHVGERVEAVPWPEERQPS